MTNEQIDAAAKVLAECMDYPWAHMPEKGRQSMREHASKVIAAALAAPPAGISPAPLAGEPSETVMQTNVADIFDAIDGFEEYLSIGDHRRARADKIKAKGLILALASRAALSANAGSQQSELLQRAAEAVERTRELSPEAWAAQMMASMSMTPYPDNLATPKEAGSQPTAVADEHYDMIDRFLRNNLDDTDYAVFSASLDALAAPADGSKPAQQGAAP